LNIAIFGGTFDPIHAAHLTIARAAAERFDLQRVLFVTAGQPPHKTDRRTESYEHRHRMVQIACAGEAGFEPSRLEAGMDKSYSIRTINRVRQTLLPQDRLFFIIGADAFSEVDTWHRWQEVIALVEFIVVTRPGHTYTVPPGTAVHRLDDLQLPVSSSAVRRQLSEGQRPAELPPAVFEYIREHGLYGFGAAGPRSTAQM
jgi:nicotinate-nucleotide adenylyltransferase